MCVCMLKSSTIQTAKRWKQIKCPSMAECINKVWSIHTTEQYSAFKRKGIPTLTITQMTLKDTTLSKIRQANGQQRWSRKNVNVLMPLNCTF